MTPPAPPCRPFTPCWCESNPNHPRCEDVVALPIDVVPLIFLAVCLIAFFVRKKFKNE